MCNALLPLARPRGLGKLFETGLEAGVIYWGVRVNALVEHDGGFIYRALEVAAEAAEPWHFGDSQWGLGGHLLHACGGVRHTVPD